MKNNRSNRWILWTLLVVGLWLAAGCGSNPTTPDPSDVQDFGFEDGGLPVDADMDLCLAAYEELKTANGGTTTVDNDSNYTLIGVFETWSGYELNNVRLLIQDGDSNQQYGFNGKVALTDVVFPITVTVFVQGYVAQTYVATSANVIAFGLERLSAYWLPALVIGYTFDEGPGQMLNTWVTAATTTHMTPWEYTVGGGTTNPYTQLLGNAYQPIGASAFIYEFDAIVGPEMEYSFELLQEFEPIGFSYAHIGTLEPGSVGGWIMNLNEEGPGTDRGTGNFTSAYPPADPGAPLGKLTVTPGGVLNDSCEFIPYYPEKFETLLDVSGTYEVISYDPPTVADRDVIYYQMRYFDGCIVDGFATWDIGSGLPDLNLGAIPTVTEATFQFGGIVNTLEAEWVHDAIPGYLLASVSDKFGNRLWDIRMPGSAIKLPDALRVPQESMLNISTFAPALTVSRVDCPGFDIDDFDVISTWANTACRNTSSVEPVIPDLGAGDGSGEPDPTP